MKSIKKKKEVTPVPSSRITEELSASSRLTSLVLEMVRSGRMEEGVSSTYIPLSVW